MSDKNSLNTIWVSPLSNEGDGSFDNPFPTIQNAISKAEKGDKILLLGGEYSEKVTIQHKKGTKHKPITIMADPDSDPVIFNNEWYFYESSDFIVSGITFKNTKHSAISLIGESKRNIFKNLTLINCGLGSECSVFLGGSGGDSNIVEGCEFRITEKQDKQIAIILSQSIDTEDESIEISKNSVLRYNKFYNYNTAIIIGTSDNLIKRGNHKIDENYFESCDEAIRVKAIGTTISNNIFKSNKNDINIIEGEDIEIIDNRFENATKTVISNDWDITFHKNLIIDGSIEINLSEEKETPLMLHDNTFYTESDKNLLNINGEFKFSITLSHNIIYGYNVSKFQGLHTHNNSGNIESEGVGIETIIFTDIKNGDYSTLSSKGCRGDASKKLEIVTPKIISINNLAEEEGYNVDKSPHADKSMEERDIYLKSMFLGDGGAIEEEDEKEPEELPSQYDHYEDGLLED